MMAQRASTVILVTALLINTLSCCSAENVYCVTPTAAFCPFCPSNSIHCTTLSEYAQEAETYFTSNTTMVFLPGDHTLDMNITVANVARLNIYGESSSDSIATIVRNGSVGFSFTNMVDFNLYSLVFTSYNRSWSYGSHPPSTSAMLLQSIPNAKLVNCSFHDNLGTALAVNDTNITLAENSKFIRNRCACQSFSEVHGYGCGIAALNSNLVFTGKSFFHDNTQTTSSYSYCGGAIWASASSLHFNGTNSFIGNSAKGNTSVGGAIYANTNSVLSFIGTSEFSHNSAGSNGGVIYAYNNVVLTFNGTNNFFSNSAERFGGAIYAGYNTSLSFIGISDFGQNSAQHYGGAIDAYENVPLTLNGANNFIDNSACNGNGGAIYTESNTSLSFIGTSDFRHNLAEQNGGAIYAYVNVILTFHGPNNFINNSANSVSGGAIYAESNASLSFIGTSNFFHNSAEQYGGAIEVYVSSVLTFNGTNNFINNSAERYGGAIDAYYNVVLMLHGINNFINNSANSFSGGAIYAESNTMLTFIGTSNFSHNSANSSGGAIDSYDNIVLTFNGTNKFINNSANSSGGAIDSYDNIVLTFNGTNKFINNSANSISGGAIYAQLNTSLSFIGTSDFRHNSAEQNGGAIYAYVNVILTFHGPNNFINNSANSVSGGAIYAESNASLSFIGTSNFYHNSAEQYGGAIEVYVSSVLTFNGTNNFINNSANSISGGAIYAQLNTSLSFIGVNNFRHNSAECYGGALDAYYNVVVTFTGINNFINNSANYEGGGAIYAGSNTSLNFSGISNFCQNSVQRYGGAIDAYDNVVLTFNGTNNFINNSAHSEGGGAIYAGLNTFVSFIGTGCTSAEHYGSRVDNVALTLNRANNFIDNSANSVSGGAIYAESNTMLTFIGTSDFRHNSAEQRGGAIYAHENVVLTFHGPNNFINNSANSVSGGAIFAESNASLSFIGTSNFCHNSAEQYGGAIEVYVSSVLTFNGTNNFINNSANSISGGAIYAVSNTMLTFIGTSNFSHNSAKQNGGAIYAYENVVLTLHGSNNFINNSANSVSGGAIYAKSNIMICIETSIFSQNSAEQYGGAIDSYDNIVLTFNGTNNFFKNVANSEGGGAIYAGANTLLNFIGTSDFSQNSARRYGGAIDAYDNVVITFNGANNFINNSAHIGGGAIYAGSNTSVNFSGMSSLTSNFAVQGGAIFVYKSILNFSENISFTSNGHNTGDNQGGAIYLYTDATFSILPRTTVYWKNNHANLGGAIYVYDSDPTIYCTKNPRYMPRECFFHLPGQNLSSGIDVQLVFKNNSADVAGSVLYGGAIDKCRPTGLNPFNYSNVFVQYEDDNMTSRISSDPFHICPCENNVPDCSISTKVLSLSPGETHYKVSVVAVGQRDGIVPANITSMDRCVVPCSQIVQQTNKTCTTLSYSVYSKQNVSLELYADVQCSTSDNKLVLKLNGTQSCTVSPQNSSIFCICVQAFRKHGITPCSSTNGLVQIKRDSSETFWVGYELSYGLGLVVHPYCPFDYCVNDKVEFSFNNTDSQCAPNRSGLLCGRCKEGYSLVLGTFQCMECTNDNLALLVPFAVMGVALVFLLLVCKLTVATGTLSGLVFYANIVGDNRTLFIPEESPALSVFIAWLNLDFGIETCFFEGMNVYSNTWLQFVFPVYLWVLVGLMIVVSHFSQKFANLLGNNPVSVLATLILLSYAKILRTLITVVYITNLEGSKGNRVVWLYDANIDYLNGKHVLLLLVALLVFIFLFLPYTLLLLFGQWLQAISHLRLFSWVNSARLKPFMDSYHAPYKAKHRYWPGLLLVLRFVLLLVFAFNPQQDPSINLLAILVVTSILHLWAWVSGGVYKNWCLDALEGSFILNVIVLSVGTYHVQLSGGNQLAVGYTSVITALVTFVGILSYHIFQQLRHTKLWKKIPQLNMKLRFKKLNKKLDTKQTEDINLNDLTNDLTESVKFDQLREPLLDDLPQPTHSVV